MKLAWLPVSDNGPMVADYIGVSYVNGNPFGVFAVAQANKGATLARVDVHDEDAACRRQAALRASAVWRISRCRARSRITRCTSTTTTRASERFRARAGLRNIRDQ